MSSRHPSWPQIARPSGARASVRVTTSNPTVGCPVVWGDLSAFAPVPHPGGPRPHQGWTLAGNRSRLRRTAWTLLPAPPPERHVVKRPSAGKNFSVMCFDFRKIRATILGSLIGFKNCLLGSV